MSKPAFQTLRYAALVALAATAAACSSSTVPRGDSPPDTATIQTSPAPAPSDQTLSNRGARGN
jgi:hypothetical protein